MGSPEQLVEPDAHRRLFGRTMSATRVAMRSGRMRGAGSQVCADLLHGRAFGQAL